MREDQKQWDHLLRGEASQTQQKRMLLKGMHMFLNERMLNMPRMRPILAVNWKNYTTGIQSFDEILTAARKAVQRYAISIILLPPHSLLSETVRRTRSMQQMSVYAQHADALRDERATGFLPVQTLKATGVKGVLLNHSEHPLPFEVLQKTRILAREEGLKVLIAARTPREAERIARLQPDLIAVEPPELIGTGRSVSRVAPRIITDAVKSVGSIPLLVGAGITSGEDAYQAVLLGAAGVLVASGIVHTQHPAESLLSIATGLARGAERKE